MTDLAQLIADLECAQVGSLHYDKRILAALGFTWRGMAYWNGQEQWKGSAQLTRSLDAIVALIERILPGVAGWSVALDTYDNSAAITDMAGETRGAVAKTLPLALCIAFLKAMEQADG